MIESGRRLTGASRWQADVVIVGTGAGGGMAASELARRGAKVIALEEGPALSARDMTQREDEMMPLLYQERGGRSTADLAIRVIGGRGVGGSTVHNINLCKRLPPEILELWGREHAVSGLSEAELRPVFESVERDLSVSEIEPERRNNNNRVLERGVAALGWKGGPLKHNRQGCQGSGFCEIGCPYDAKQNAAKILLPDAMDHGARVVSDVRVTRILHDGRRARGVVGVALGVDGRQSVEVRVDANVVVLAGSAIGSPALGVASSLPDPHARLGRGLRMHPGVAVAGLFDERIEGWRGIPQSYECTELLELSPGSDKRVWITTAFAHPIGAAIMLPGFGERHRAWMLRYPNIAVLTAMLHDDSEGRVSLGRDGRPRIDYVLSQSDSEQLARGVRACARLLFAAGATKVLVPSVPPIELSRPDEVESIPGSVARPHGMLMAAVHPMGTMCLGDDPRRAVVKSTGEHHQVAGLFVLDGSLFPTSIGGPPQIGIYTLARYLSRHVG
ncbi:MAG: GMC family oxidoreductase [Myxococcales bacterium]|nr:GMC family oxidoreductase [Myxococcales bacterium]